MWILLTITRHCCVFGQSQSDVEFFSVRCARALVVVVVVVGHQAHTAAGTEPGFLLLCTAVSLLGAYCSSKSCNHRFFFLFYTELGSVIRAPFLTDRSISITKSCACSNGCAPCSRATARATPADRNGTEHAVDEVVDVTHRGSEK